MESDEIMNFTLAIAVLLRSTVVLLRVDSKTTYSVWLLSEIPVHGD